jgi:hypothetical protein
MFCECGCGKSTTICKQTSTRKGRVKGRPNRFVHGHNGRRSVGERFEEHCPTGASDECWIWTGRLVQTGMVNSKATLCPRCMPIDGVMRSMLAPYQMDTRLTTFAESLSV